MIKGQNNLRICKTEFEGKISTSSRGVKVLSQNRIKYSNQCAPTVIYIRVELENLYNRKYEHNWRHFTNACCLFIDAQIVYLIWRKFNLAEDKINFIPTNIHAYTPTYYEYIKETIQISY